MTRRLLPWLALGLVLVAPARGADKVFVGYLYGPARNLDFKLYTHLCHAFLTADGDGSLRPSGNVPGRALADQAHQAGVKMLVSLGGWGWDEQFASIVSRPESEDRYVEAVMKLVESADYDGIDLDWEYPDTAAEVVGFERLSRRFRKELDALGKKKGRPMLLTMAAAANPGTLKWLDPKFLVETLDWVNVMTYDFAGAWLPLAGHNSPLFTSSKTPGSTEASIKYLLDERKVPADKLALGIPLYGRGFAVKEPYAPTRGAPRVRVPGGDYRGIHKLLHEQKWTRQWDDETKVPWLLSPDRTMVIGYDDAESVGLKTAWAMKRGLRGVFFWQVHGDRLPDGSNPLQQASRRAWEKGAGPGGQ